MINTIMDKETPTDYILATLVFVLSLWFWFNLLGIL